MTKRMSGDSIARKLLAMALVSAGSAGVIAGGVAVGAALDAQALARRQSLETTAQLAAALLAEDPNSTALNRLRAAPGVGAIRIEDADGAPSADAAAPIGDGRRVVIEAAPGGVDVGQTLFLLARALLAAGVAAIVALLAAQRLRRSIVQPLAALSDAIVGLREGKPIEPVESAANDETGKLIDGFNDMLAELRRRDQRLDAQMRELEREVKRRTEDLLVAKTAAERANRAKTQFLATMSHEIRTPMHGALVMAELLAASNLPDRERRYADVIVQSGKSLLAIINDLLDLSKIEAGRLQLEVEPVDLVRVADQVTALFWEKAREKSLDLVAYVAPGTPYVLGDSIRLGQILANLVGNGVKFTGAGFVSVWIGCDPRRPGVLLMSVRDSGIGVPKHLHEEIFSEFTQADQDTTRAFGGTGLGLAICRKLTRAMGGDVRVASEPGKGAVFTAELKLQSAEPAPAWPQMATPQTVQIDTVLPASRRALARYFEAAGCEILPAGAEGPLANIYIADAARLETGPIPAGAKRIVLRAAGDPAVEATLASGLAHASLSLPLSRDEIEAVLQSLADGALVGGQLVEAGRGQAQLRFNGAVALVADDNDVNLEVAVEALSRFGIRAETAQNGLDAARLALERRYDIVFMDGSMPKMDGFEAVQRIRTAEAARGSAAIPIIALTADVFGAPAAAWRDAGADDILYKPFTVAALSALLAKHLADKSVQAESGETRAEPSVSGGDHLVGHVLSLGSPTFVRRVAGLYIDQAPQRLKAIADAAAAGDWDEAAKNAHALKSMSMSLKLEAVSRVAAEIERRVRIDGLAPTPTDIGLLDAILADHIDRLRRVYGEQAAAGALDLAPALAAAIEADRLALEYQPIVDRGGAELLGFEALMRWPAPDAPKIGAQAIVACAEAHGFADRLCAWSLRRACREAVAWQGRFVSVNVSPAQLRDHGFPALVRRVLGETGLPPDRLVLEITEQSTLAGEARVAEIVMGLRAHGVRIALDDFGTGYSSLTHLRRFPIDLVKIDRSYVADLGSAFDAAALIHAIAALGRTLRFQVVAEGVEWAEQHSFLKAAGVHAMQGWHFGRPGPPTEALRLVQQGGPGRTFRAAG